MKRIRRHIYYVEQLKKVDGEIQSVTNPDGSLFSGVYKTKIFPEDLPEWYRQDRYYKRLGYMSTQGIVDMVYIPSRLGTFLKDDVLLVSYVNKIEKLHSDQSLPTYQCYRGYDEEISGSAIITILSGAKKYSNYNLKPIKKLMERQWEWLKEEYPNVYKEGEWQFDFDKAIAEAYVNYKAKKKV